WALVAGPPSPSSPAMPPLTVVFPPAGRPVPPIVALLATECSKNRNRRCVPLEFADTDVEPPNWKDTLAVVEAPGVVELRLTARLFSAAALAGSVAGSARLAARTAHTAATRKSPRARFFTS